MQSAGQWGCGNWQPGRGREVGLPSIGLPVAIPAVQFPEIPFTTRWCAVDPRRGFGLKLCQQVALDAVPEPFKVFRALLNVSLRLINHFHGMKQQT